MRRLYRSASIVAVACGFAYSSVRADGVDELDDAVARMQYAFYAAETRGVEEALGIIQKVRLPPAMYALKEYFSAYGQWKLAELHTQDAVAGRRESRGAASKAASACERAAQDAQRVDPRFAEAHALEAVCASMPSRAANVLSFGSCAKHRGLRTAQELAPNNPRVMLIAAQCADGGADARTTASLERLKRVVQAFEAAQPSRPGWPDWGQAEALLMLGESYLQRGDTVAARDPIERALVIAPDYRKARDALEKAAAGQP